jgi:hypothetical protein
MFNRSSRMLIRLVLLSCNCLVTLAVTLSASGTPSSALEYRPWSEWYPMDRGQPAGQRTYNWWTKRSGRPQMWYYGQSTWRYPGTPDTLPATDASGTPITYFFNWGCAFPIDDARDPSCEDWTVDLLAVPAAHPYLEIITESEDHTELQHWARGNRRSWEVYYRRDAIVDHAGEPACTGANIAQRYDDAYLQSPSVKQPFILKLPTGGDRQNVSTSAPICAIVYGNWFQRVADIIDRRSTPGAGQVQWQTGDWFFQTRVLSSTVDGDGVEIVQAENIYYTDNTAQQSTFIYCSTPTAPDYLDYCDPVTHTGKLATSAPDAQDRIVQGRAFAFERYWMRRIPLTNRRSNGFGAFYWWTWNPIDLYDYDDTYGPQPGSADGWSTYQPCTLNGSGRAVCRWQTYLTLIAHQKM